MDDVETTETAETAERHASWAELFFDLVAVAGVGVLAHVLHDEIGATSSASTPCSSWPSG